jgi:lipase maturation factor 1
MDSEPAARPTWRRVLWGDVRPSYAFTRWLFLRLLGFIYFFAFSSMAVQVMGLIGSRGILPVEQFLPAVKNAYSDQAYLLLPTLAWLDSSDAFLRVLTVGGALLSALVVLDIGTGPVLLILWAFYLSIVAAGQDFMSFQWDYLLLETGFLAIFFARWSIRPPRLGDPSLIMVWLYRLLLFRLMFGSGAAKWLSGDPTWHNLTALSYHYETQPLPTVAAWYAHQLPLWFHQLSTALTLFVEMVVPFLFFAPRRIRFVAGAVIIFLQVLIMITGNYTFFNLLTIALCIPLFDDTFFQRLFPRRMVQTLLATATPTNQVPVYWRIPVIAIAVVILVLSGTRLTEQFARGWSVPAPAIELANTLAPFGLVNSYGLFAVMTTERPEIIVEGSNDGQTWLPYEFPAKPGDVTKAPRWVAPYQPRLDWQMWFAALGGDANDPWFSNFMNRLQEGSPDVLALLARNPFPEAPPRYIRAILYDYRFTDTAARQATGAWWRRQPKRQFYPVTSPADR